jgi:hypothetical protein
VKITTYNDHRSAPFSEPWSSNSYQVYLGIGADAVIQSAVPLAVFGAAYDGSEFAANIITKVFTPDTPEMIEDGYGHLIRNPAMADVCQELGGCN